jgi:hypothetical protein
MELELGLSLSQLDSILTRLGFRSARFQLSSISGWLDFSSTRLARLVCNQTCGWRGRDNSDCHVTQIFI